MSSPEFTPLHSNEVRVVISVPGEESFLSTESDRPVLFSDPPRQPGEEGLVRLTNEKRALTIASRRGLALPPLSMDRSLGNYEGISGFLVRPASGTTRTLPDNQAVAKFSIREALYDAETEDDSYISPEDLYFLKRAFMHKVER
ncbi:MAG: hypothetical protein WAV04_02720 [Candidatus Microsaccharimonas sp.]